MIEFLAAVCAVGLSVPALRTKFCATKSGGKGLKKSEIFRCSHGLQFGWLKLTGNNFKKCKNKYRSSEPTSDLSSMFYVNSS